MQSSLSHHSGSLTLAQSLDPKIWMYSGLLLLVLGLGAIVIFALRRKLFSNNSLDSNPTGGGLMEHLDGMLKSGKITKEEYDQTRKAIIAKAVERMNESATDAQENEQ